MDTKRLFLFAAYDSQGVVGESLVWYVKSLSAYGDVVLVADNACLPGELDKLLPYTLHCAAERHGAYDFGSYRRAFLWASEHISLDGYSYLYLVNDSVFGPLDDISGMLSSMESLGTSAFSMVMNPSGRAPHLQSWFIGVGRDVFLSSWFADFMESVVPQKDKNAVCEIYENGLSRLLRSRGIAVDAVMRVPGKKIYNSVRHLYLKGLPFVKKSSFTRHNGCLGRQLKYILDRAGDGCREAILSDAGRVYGEDYMRWLLDCGRMEAARRYLAYLAGKIKGSRNA